MIVYAARFHKQIAKLVFSGFTELSILNTNSDNMK